MNDFQLAVLYCYLPFIVFITFYYLTQPHDDDDDDDDRGTLVPAYYPTQSRNYYLKGFQKFKILIPLRKN